ncbi:DUF1178 family protein [Pseudopelagicola sp. nBUS_19]|uniref:DUF1178 family protein n=1 Tax=Pseudopelagicola sp. nBUS_19 TaxID=3395316 RepID=UPI003EB70084
MISYTLKCAKNHRFESWFKSADAYEKLQSSGMVTCSVCGDPNVEKAMMAPRVSHARTEAAPKLPTKDRPLSSPGNPTQQALAELRRKVEDNSDYVGDKFASEARAMHEGAAPERAIYGEAKPEDAKSLIEDGIPVTPLPFNIGRKTN